VPGMISLILLPVLCVWFLQKNYHEERCVEIGMPLRYDPNRQKDSKNIRFDTTLLSRKEYKRNYVNFELNGNAIHDKNTLKSFNEQLLKIVENDDTINGLHINIKNSAKYSSMIEIIDICKKDSSSSFYAGYCFYDNEFWYFHCKRPKKTEEEEYISVYGGGCCVYDIPSEEEDFNTFFQDKNIIKMKYFFVIFLAFSLISIFYIWYNFIKKRKT
jgi:hypothetical protein